MFRIIIQSIVHDHIIQGLFIAAVLIWAAGVVLEACIYVFVSKVPSGPVQDEEAVVLLRVSAGLTKVEAEVLVKKWRDSADNVGYHGPVATWDLTKKVVAPYAWLLEENKDKK